MPNTKCLVARRRCVDPAALAAARARADRSQSELAREAMEATGRGERVLQSSISAIERGVKATQPTETVREWERLLGLGEGDLSNPPAYAWLDEAGSPALGLLPIVFSTLAAAYRAQEHFGARRLEALFQTEVAALTPVVVDPDPAELEAAARLAEALADDDFRARRARRTLAFAAGEHLLPIDLHALHGIALERVREAPRGAREHRVAEERRLAELLHARRRKAA